jgi:hypothetical protein
MENHIFSMDANGGDRKIVVNGSVENMDFDVYNNKIFWIDETSKKVFSIFLIFFALPSIYIATTDILSICVYIISFVTPNLTGSFYSINIHCMV